jgi:hypothetical protein
MAVIGMKGLPRCVQGVDLESVHPIIDSVSSYISLPSPQAAAEGGHLHVLVVSDVIAVE